MRRRDFLAILGAAAVTSSIRANAQQQAVVGFLRPTKAEESGHLVAAVREGLRESGYDKVLIEARWGDGREDQLPKFARELVALPVAAILAGSLPAARAAKAATPSIPTVFRDRLRSADGGARVQPQSTGRQPDRGKLL